MRRLILVFCLLFSSEGISATSERAHSRELLRKDGRTLELNISGEFREGSRQQVVEWISFIADSLRTVLGHWPRQHCLVEVIPAPAAGQDPIPWAEVRRGPVNRVIFYIDPGAEAGALIQAWTGYHEFAHLLIPYQGYGGNWFSEGLASYYQNILQARSGVISEQEMWQKLYDGFQRGLMDTRQAGKPLKEASREMRREGGFMRVYWSGAWYFLAADVRLRQQSGNQKTLDMALTALNQCCADQSLSAPRIVHKLDELNRVLLFQTLFDQVDASLEVPSFESLFASLGISVRDGTVHLQEVGPGVEIRRSITLGDI